MRQFYREFSKWNAVRSILSWTHYRILLKIEKSKEVMQVGNIIKDPFVLEFLDVKESRNLSESRFGLVFYNYIIIGLILCTEKNKTIVKYSLLNVSKQIFASKYQLYFPATKQLGQEIQREIEQIEQEKNLSGK